MCQEPALDSQHGSTPHISVTESTPERGRRLLSTPAHQPHHSSCTEVPRCSSLRVPDESFRPSLVGEFDPCWAVWLQQAQSVDQQEHFMNLISNGQRGRLDDQRCSLDPSRSAPCTPNNSRKVDVSSAGEICLCPSFAYGFGFSFYFQEVWNGWLHFLVHGLNVQILTSSSASWPTHRVGGLMISASLFRRCRGYRRNRRHPPQGRILAICATWCPKCRLAPLDKRNVGSIR